MPHSNGDSAASVKSGTSDAEYRLDLVLAVGNSRIGNVVVGKIAERAGLKALATTPENAGEVLSSEKPATVILDGGADDNECNVVMESLAAQRTQSGGRLPVVIFLSSMDMSAPTAYRNLVDAVVAKPVNPDRLQPLMQTLLAEARD